MRKLLPLAAAVLSLSLAGCSGSHPAASGAAARPSAPSGASAPSTRTRISAYLRDDVTDGQRHALDQKLHRLPGLRDVSFESKEQAYQKFKQEFQGIDPDMVAKTDPDSLPESYSATVVGDTLVEPIATIFVNTDGIASVTVAPAGTTPPARLGTIVQIPRSLSADLREGIENAIRALPGIGELRFESADAAYTRLSAACRDEPELAAALRPEMALSSYRFTFTLGSPDAAPPAITLDRLPLVVSVLTVPTAVL